MLIFEPLTDAMKINRVLIVMLLAGGSLFAQFENPNRNKEIPGIPQTNAPTGNNNGNNFFKPKDTIAPLQLEKKSGVNMGGGTRWYSDSDKYARRLNQSVRKQETTQQGQTGNKFLGQLKTLSKVVTIVYRDHEYPDGDIVRVLHNNRTAMDNVWLTSEFKSFNIVLITGFNEIQFQALNQGDSGPNTAEFHILDENGKLIFSNKWLLSTGAKATVMVVKEASGEIASKEENK